MHRDRRARFENLHLRERRIGAVVVVEDLVQQRAGRRGRLRHRRHARDAVKPHRRGDPRDERRALVDGAGRGDVQVYEGPRVAAIVHVVVDQLRVPLRRNALPGRVEERLVGDGILEVTEMIPFVGEQLEQGHAQVGGAALAPRPVALRGVVEQHLPEARVVLRQIVERRLGERVGRTPLDRRAVEVDRAARPEVDRRDGEQPVQHGEHVGPQTAGAARPADRQEVGRVVTLLIDLDVEDRRSRSGHRLLHRHADDARAAVDVDRRRIGDQAVGAGRQRVDEVHVQQEGAGLDLELDEIDAVERRLLLEQAAPFRIAAAGAERGENLRRGRETHARLLMAATAT